MTQRILCLMVAAFLFMGSTTFAQEKKESPASPSDISVDKIKSETAKPAATQDKAAKPAAKKQADATPAAKKDDTPKPVAEGTPVAQPGCKSGCNDCDPCQRKCRGRLLNRIRSRLGRRCCCS